MAFVFALVKLCFPVFVVLLPTNVFGLKIKFFDNLQNEVFQSQHDNVCTTLPEWMAPKAYFAKVDGCVILYSERDCTSFSTKLTSEQEPSNVYNLLENHTGYSFHSCNSSEGGNQVIIDLYNDDSTVKYSEKNLSAQIQDLCTCAKIPADVKSLNNHGNCVQLFDDEKCSENGKVIPPGRSALSNNLIEHGIEKKKSIKACQEPSHCLRMHATIIKFEVANSDNKNLRSSARTLNVQMATNGTFINNGNGTVTQEYVAKKMIQEVTSINRLQSLTTMHSVNISANVQFENNFGLFYVDQSKLLANLVAGYNFSSNATSKTAESHTVTEVKMFQSTQKIEIPPCTSYEISSFIRFIEKHPLNYKVHVQITAQLGDERLTAEDTAKRLTDMVFQNKVDDFTILAIGKAHAFVDFGMESFINGQSIRVNNCCGVNCDT